MIKFKQIKQYCRWIWQIGKLYWVSSEKLEAITIAIVYIVLIILSNQFLLMFLNFQGKLLTALQAKSFNFYHIFFITTGFVFLYISSNLFKSYVQQKLELYWRGWLNKDLLEKYFSNRAYYKINSNQQIDNPDERLSDDIESFVKNTLNYSFSLGDTFIKGFLFINVLWSVNHFLVFLAIFIAAIQTLISIFIGKPLILLREKSLKLEPDFRYSLVNARNNSESIAFYQGESQELDITQVKLKNLLTILHQIVLPENTVIAFASIIGIGSGFIAELILAPQYFAGTIEFGDISRSLVAFSNVFGVFSWLSSSFDGLTTYAAIIKRLGTFSDFLEQNSLALHKEETIETIIDERLKISHLTLQTPDRKRTLVRDLYIEVPIGKGILLQGASGTGKSSILRAIAGLWNSGSGYIYRPEISKIFFLPQRPYMILSSLRAQLLYPHTQRNISDRKLQSILTTVNLTDLVEQVGGFDVELNWPDVLSLGEQQRLGFARLLLASPRYAILDESTSALDIDNEKHLYQILKSLNITFVSVGHRSTLLQHHQYVVKILDRGNWQMFHSSDLH
jgi:putative ATP-binding cassette transporter